MLPTFMFPWNILGACVILRFIAESDEPTNMLIGLRPAASSPSRRVRSTVPHVRIPRTSMMMTPSAWTSARAPGGMAVVEPIS